MSEKQTYDERFSRTGLMLGNEGMEKLTGSHVIVAGLGAVGSYATEALVRSGIGKLTLIDFDEVGKTNINRQLYALESTLGHLKKDVAVKRVKDINPECDVTGLKIFINHDTVDEIIALKPDMVIDAIDSLGPKTELLIALRQNNIPIISCLGAALRTDVTRIKVGKLKKTRDCPLARMVRKRLKRRDCPMDFDCVYSTEPVEEIKQKAILSEEESEPNFYEQGRKRRTMGSLPTITGIFGLTAANEVIKRLSGGFK